MEWSSTPFLNTSRQELAKNQKHSLTWARTAELSGRGVPSRWQRSISLRMSAAMASSGTYIILCFVITGLRERNSLREPISDLHILRLELDARGAGLHEQNLGEILLGQAVADHLLDQITCIRCERHRHGKALRRIEAEIQVLQ